MTCDVAERVVATLMTASSSVDRSIEWLAHAGSLGDELTAYRRIAGKIMGNVYLHMLRPIFDACPELQTAVYPGAQRDPEMELARQLRAVFDGVTAAIAEVQPYFGSEAESSQFAVGAGEVERAIEDAHRLVTQLKVS